MKVSILILLHGTDSLIVSVLSALCNVLAHARDPNRESKARERAQIRIETTGEGFAMCRAVYGYGDIPVDEILRKDDPIDWKPGLIRVEGANFDGACIALAKKIREPLGKILS